MRTIFLLVAVALGGLAWADDPKPTEADRKEALRLVKQLGSSDGKEQLAARQRLLELGPAAVEAVKEGRTSDSARVADWCERLIVRLREAGHDSPAWKEFDVACGNNGSAWRTYRALLKESDLNYWLEKIDDDPAAAEGAYQEALDTLMRWYARFPEAQRGWRLPPYPQAAFLLFVGGLDAAAKVKGPTGDVPAKDYQEAMRVVVQTVVRAVRPEEESVGLKLLAHWMVAQTRDESKLAALCALALYGVPNRVVLPLMAWASGKSGSLAVRVRSLGLAAATGADVTQAAESLLRVKDEYATAKLTSDFRDGPPKVLTAQARDVAAVHLVLARGYDPADFGFVHLSAWWDSGSKKDEEPREWGEYPARIARFGFTDRAARERAHATVAALLVLKLARVQYGKVVVPPADPPELLAVIAQIERDARAVEVPSAKTILDRVYALYDVYPDHRGRIVYEATRIVLDTGPTSTLGLTDALDRFRRLRPDPLGYVSILRRLADRELSGNGKFALHRANAADHLLAAYAEVLKLELPDKRPGVPTTDRLSPDATARERAEFIATRTACREARYVCDLMDARDAVVAQLVDLYKPDSAKPGRDEKGPDELKTLAEKKLSKEAAEALMKQIK